MIIILIILIAVLFLYLRTIPCKEIETYSSIGCSRYSRFYPHIVSTYIDNREFNTPGGIQNQLVASKPLSVSEIRQELSKIKYETSPYKFLELSPAIYGTLNDNQAVDYDEILNESRYQIAVDNGFQYIKKIMEGLIQKHKKEIFCDVGKVCQVGLQDWRIYGIGTANEKRDVLWDLQLLVGISSKNVVHVFRIIQWEQRGIFKVLSLKLEGEMPSYILSSGIRETDVKPFKDFKTRFVELGNIPLWNGPVDSSGYMYNSNEMMRLVLSDEETKALLDKKADEVFNEYRCYGDAKAFNKIDCEATTDVYGKVRTPGVWDRPCRYDNECPFYKANRNYPNEFGGCKSGLCEMPVGIERRGARQYGAVERAICRNCKEEDRFNNCCEKQKDYRGLLSADYVFENDIQTRNQQIETLKKRGLNPL